MVGLDRLELSTSPLSGVRSNHLSYRPGQGSKTHKAIIPKRAVNPKSVRREERETKAASSRNAVVSDQSPVTRRPKTPIAALLNIPSPVKEPYPQPSLVTGH